MCPDTFQDFRSDNSYSACLHGGAVLQERMVNQLKYFKMKSKDGLKEKMLEEIFNELERQAYNQDYHNYSVKETNQIIRKYFEILITASQQCQKPDCYEKEFVEWINKDRNWSIAALHDYWLTNIKDK